MMAYFSLIYTPLFTDRPCEADAQLRTLSEYPLLKKEAVGIIATSRQNSIQKSHNVDNT